MSKRSRLTTEDARRAGLHAWETPEGRRWLMKALNPNDTALPTNGIPSLQSRNISVLNWQGEYSIFAPENVTTEIPNYDTTLFLYQHPLIFGLSASRPGGCMDLREYDGYLSVKRTEIGSSGTYTYELSTSHAAGKPISMSRTARYLNNQIDPSIFKGDDSLAGRRVLFNQLTQKNRIIYGGATIIPTCSNQYNSGSLAVSQTVFCPRRTALGADTNIELDTFTDEDFPDTSDTVQNPQMYYGRYQDGAYIPYKLNEPAATPYVGSEQQVTTRCPYYVEDVSFIGPTAASTGSPAAYELEEVFTNYSSVANKTFVATAKTAMYACCAVRFYIVFFTGQRGHITFSLGDADAKAASLNSNVIFTNENGSGATLVNQKPDVLATEDTNVLKSTVDSGELNNLYIKLPESITAWQWNKIGEQLANPYGSYFISEDISKDPSAAPELKVGTICPFNGQSIVAVHMSGVSNTAPVKMILRYGSEILLVASSPYSPFKFMSPRYDESAIKSYARCIRSMKDAYFANTGAVPGQLDYTNKLMTLIENDSADDLNRTLNQGGTWYGVVQ